MINDLELEWDVPFLHIQNVGNIHFIVQLIINLKKFCTSRRITRLARRPQRSDLLHEHKICSMKSKFAPPYLNLLTEQENCSIVSEFARWR